MAKITHIIPSQRVELLRDRIGSILATEISNQSLLQNDEEINAKVWNSRILQFDKSELPAINVYHTQSSFDNKDRIDADNECLFSILVCVRNANPEDELDNKSLIVRDKINGIIRYILEHPEYKTFDFAPPFVITSIVQQIENVDINQIQETDYIVKSLITLSVKIHESITPLNPNQLLSHLTNVRLSLTDKGYVYELNEN